MGDAGGNILGHVRILRDTDGVVHILELAPDYIMPLFTTIVDVPIGEVVYIRHYGPDQLDWDGVCVSPGINAERKQSGDFDANGTPRSVVMRRWDQA